MIAVRGGKEPSRSSTKFLFIENPFEPGEAVVMSSVQCIEMGRSRNYPTCVAEILLDLLIFI